MVPVALAWFTVLGALIFIRKQWEVNPLLSTHSPAFRMILAS